MTNLNILYRFIKKEAERRDNVYKNFIETNHPDALEIFNFHNGIVNDAIKEYLENGGKREIKKFQK